MTKQCNNCSKTFNIIDQDQEFYRRITVPEPTLCPDCRQQRRLSWCNEMTLYPGQCGLCKKTVLTMYAPNSPYMYYCRDCWWSDKWDPLQFGQAINWQKNFFPQLEQMNKAVPQCATSTSGRDENCDYMNFAGDSKNCYLTFHADLNENCLYGYGIKECKDCVDGYNNFKCELCYACIDCYDSYHLLWSQDCTGCSDSYMLKDCVGCRNCFGCVGLRNQEYCWFNEQLTAEQYHQKLAGIDLGSKELLDSWLVKAKKFQKTKFYKFIQGSNNEQSNGNNLYQSIKAKNSFDCKAVENGNHCYQLSLGVKDSYDYYQYGMNSELIYEGTIIGGDCYNIKFSHNIFDKCQNLEYCIGCTGSKNCFGCSALRNKQWCIFNKQYTEAEYYDTVKKLKALMLQTKEYGEFFPSQISPFCYNETSAQWWFPLTAQQALSASLTWQDQLPGTYNKGTVYDLPDNIRQVGDDVLKEVLSCAECNKNYKIIVQELDFYRKYSIPLPAVCFNCRQLTRRNLRNPRKLWQRHCMCTQPDHQHKGRCSTDFETTYSPDRKELIYCEDCYKKEVY